MKPQIIELDIEIASSAESLWTLLTDWERQGEWMLEASDFVVVSDHRAGVGVEAEATVRIGGVSTRDRIRTDVWDPPRHLGILHLGWVKGRGDLRLTPLTEDRTRVDWREELHPPLGPLGALGMRLFRPLMRRIFERDLRALAHLAASKP